MYFDLIKEEIEFEFEVSKYVEILIIFRVLLPYYLQT